MRGRLMDGWLVCRPTLSLLPIIREHSVGNDHVIVLKPRLEIVRLGVVNGAGAAWFAIEFNETGTGGGFVDEDGGSGVDDDG